MTNEHWQQVKQLLHQALELAPGERTAFLDKVCSSDKSLRKEVEAFLASSDQMQSTFLRSSTWQRMLRPGMKLGEYEVEKLIGSGGMGEVYRAYDSRLNRDVAIKVLPPSLSTDPDRLRRFEQEARAAAALNHPGILVVHQMGTHEGAPYLVSELLEGDTLRQRLATGPLPLRKAIDYSVQIARGLAAAHEKGVIHRDLKPDNLFVTKDDRVKILDFGLAKLIQPQERADRIPSIAGDASEPGLVMGTLGYMAPEQVRGEMADHRADIFAFGVILWEMLTGKRAFQKHTSIETMSAILKEEPPAVSEITSSIPPGLARVVHRCLEKSPERRFQSASDLAFALEALSDAGQPTSFKPVSRSARARVGVIAGAVAGFAAVILGAWFLWPHLGPSSPASPAPQAQAGERQDQGTEERKSRVAHQKKAEEHSAAAMIPVASRAAASEKSALAIAGKVKVNPQDGLRYIWIPPGKFMMGCSPNDAECEPDEQPAHEVTITRGFWIGQTEVTQAAYERVVGRDPSVSQGPDLPVNWVSWFQANGYCEAVGMRLPTEAEWEYAARAGLTSAHYGNPNEVAWWFGNSGRQTHEVAQKKPNSYGLYDMLGNVAEWTADWYGPYAANPLVDPHGPASGDFRVTRGGSWLGRLKMMRFSSRVARKPGAHGNFIGIRCAGD